VVFLQPKPGTRTGLDEKLLDYASEIAHLRPDAEIIEITAGSMKYWLPKLPKNYPRRNMAEMLYYYSAGSKAAGFATDPDKAIDYAQSVQRIMEQHIAQR
jgi:hypothetical protein